MQSLEREEQTKQMDKKPERLENQYCMKEREETNEPMNDLLSRSSQESQRTSEMPKDEMTPAF